MTVPALQLVTPPTETPVSLDEVKSHLRIDTDDEDDVLTAFLAAATQSIDGKDGSIGRALVTQQWRLYLDHFPVAMLPNAPYTRSPYVTQIRRFDILIPMPPLQEVTAIEYLDQDNVWQTLDPSDYIVDSVTEPARIAPAFGKMWPLVNVGLTSTNAVKVTFTAGYGDPSAVPDTIKLAIKLLVGSWYENREAVVSLIRARGILPLPMAVDMLLNNHRVGWL